MIRGRQVLGKPYPRNAMTKDHIKPRVYGGFTTPDNLIAACAQCNQLRGEIDAVAFRNLLRKWFKRDPGLQERWHNITQSEFNELKQVTLRAHERQLHGLALRFVEFAFRHTDFSHRERRRLNRA